MVGAIQERVELETHGNLILYLNCTKTKSNCFYHGCVMCSIKFSSYAQPVSHVGAILEDVKKWYVF